MKAFEVAIALIVAVAAFVVLKLIGLIVKFALIAAVIGFVAGLLLARSLRPRVP
jgi:membrane associated rhomboid family serine protease